jgi:acyl-CoA thioesterase-2
MTAPRLSSLLERLDLEQLERDIFRGHTPNDGRPRVFGGLVAAQALVAASRTVEGMLPHSLHAYFLRPGSPKIPIVYEVDRIRDGASFVTRRVNAVQDGEAIFSVMVSFQKEEEGLEHQDTMPHVHPPEGLASSADLLQAYYERTQSPVFDFLLRVERPIEHRDPDPIDLLEPKPHVGQKCLWFRGDGEMDANPITHLAVMTFATDMGLLDNCIQHHGYTWLSPDLMIASLDHAIWFHRPVDATKWLLYVMESPSSTGGRGMNLGRIYTREGVLVASVAQESLMRKRVKRAHHTPTR